MPYRTIESAQVYSTVYRVQSCHYVHVSGVVAIALALRMMGKISIRICLSEQQGQIVSMVLAELGIIFEHQSLWAPFLQILFFTEKFSETFSCAIGHVTFALRSNITLTYYF